MEVYKVSQKVSVKEAYSKAATEGIALCSTSAYTKEELVHIPEDVINNNQGCGSPISMIKDEIRPGQVIVDLGSGAGLDIFIASGLVGAEGTAIGVDMTPEMIEIANRNRSKVAENFGFSAPNTRFVEASIESLPLEDNSVDWVVSNCVLNLSEDKQATLNEIYRVLKPGGRCVISDVFTTAPLPNFIKLNERMYNLCLGGALTMQDFVRIARQSGLRGVRLREQSRYSQIGCYQFLSLTIDCVKLDPSSGAHYNYATLIGPCSRVVIETGQTFVRGKTSKIDRDVASLLDLPCYREFFHLQADAGRDFESPLKPPQGDCVWNGEFVTLIGPFLAADDDDGHKFRSGVEMEICDKTLRTVQGFLFDKLFVSVNQNEDGSFGGQSQPGCC
jgi:SAM-dependent methyltransferase